MACEDGVFNTWPGFPAKKVITTGRHKGQEGSGCEGINYGVIIKKHGPSGKYLIEKYKLMCPNISIEQGVGKKDTIEGAMEAANYYLRGKTRNGGKVGIHDRTGEYCESQVPAEPEPVEESSPLPQEPQTTFFQGIADAVRNMVGGDATPSPEERTMSDNEKAQIEEHIRNMDIDFKEEMRNNGVTLTNLGNNAWEEIRNAVRDGTLPLTNYNNDYLRGKLEQEGYFTMQEPADQDPLRFGDQIQDMGKVRQDDFGGKEKPPAQPPMGGPIEYDREGRPKDMPMEEPRGNLFGGFLEMLSHHNFPNKRKK